MGRSQALDVSPMLQQGSRRMDAVSADLDEGVALAVQVGEDAVLILEAAVGLLAWRRRRGRRRRGRSGSKGAQHAGSATPALCMGSCSTPTVQVVEHRILMHHYCIYRNRCTIFVQEVPYVPVVE